jgi:putative glycosyltransferase (TIGR04372 family)
MHLINLRLMKKYIDALPFNISVRFIRPFYRLVRYVFFQCITFLCIPLGIILIYTPIAAILSILKIKFPDFFVERIGHLVCEPDCFIKENLLKTHGIPRAIILAPRPKTANQELLKHWSKYFVIIQNPVLVSFLRPLQRHPLTKFPTFRYVTALNHSADVFQINTNWGARPALLQLESSDNERGYDALRRMGVPDGGWYVCVHAREGQYSPVDEHLHSYRNISIDDFEKSIAYITSKGGVCIRMGDASMTPASKIPGLIDYARSEFKRDWMDLFLAANCRFFLGSNSGAFAMASVFGKPCAIVGMAPLSVAPFRPPDIFLPMLYKSVTASQVMSFRQILQSSSSTFRIAEEFEKAGIALIKNTDDEILDLTIEQLDRTQGNYLLREDAERLQRKFKGLLKPGHYCYGTAARIGDSFLRKYQHLLE